MVRILVEGGSATIHVTVDHGRTVNVCLTDHNGGQAKLRLNAPELQALIDDLNSAKLASIAGAKTREY